MSYQAILTDLDGVIRQWPTADSTLEARYGLPYGSIRNVAFEPGLLRQVTTGSISDQEWREVVVSKLDSIHSMLDIRSAVAEWSEPVGLVDHAVLQQLVDAAKGLKLVLISNATSRLSSDLIALGIRDSFDAIVNSSEVGFAKPDAAIFHHALAVAQISAEEALFIDDSKANVEAATEVGIRSLHFTGKDSLRAFLESGT